jgi:pimeloyl-ACP methyl ester carboxylesterase
MGKLPTLRVRDGIAVWSCGRDAADIDVWFLHCVCRLAPLLPRVLRASDIGAYPRTPVRSSGTWRFTPSTARAHPGAADYLSLTCPCIYYWDSMSATADSKAFLARHDFRDRRTTGRGHWPMVTAPAQFDEAVEQDVLRASD